MRGGSLIQSVHADKDNDNSPHHSDEFPAGRRLEAGKEEGQR